MLGNMSTMAIKNSGTLSTRLIQNRRDMSTSSGLAASSAVTVRGSSAMPQIGQLPGLIAHNLRMHRANPLGTRGWRGDLLRLQRHAALWTTARLILPHFRIHRTDVSSRR